MSKTQTPRFSGEIVKAVLNNKNHLKVSYCDHKSVGADTANAKVSSGWDQMVHPDLIKMFNCLKGHAAYIGSLKRKEETDPTYYKNRQCVNDTELIHYEIRGFELKGTLEMDGGSILEDASSLAVILHVRKMLPRGGYFDFVLPAVKLYQGSDYDFSGILADDIEDCKAEVMKYMDGKFFSTQTSLFDQPQEELEEF